MTELGFSNFYQILFEDGFQIQKPEDLVKCVAYAYYQAEKKKFSEDPQKNPTGDVRSERVKMWSQDQLPELYMHTATEVVYEIMESASLADLKENFIAVLEDQEAQQKESFEQFQTSFKKDFEAAVGWKRSTLQGIAVNIITAVAVFIVFIVTPVGMSIINRLSDEIMKSMPRMTGKDNTTTGRLPYLNNGIER